MITQESEAVTLLRYALHLRQYGERAPGGNETWAEFDRRAEAYLRSLMAEVPEPVRAPVASVRHINAPPNWRGTRGMPPSPIGPGCNCTPGMTWSCPRHGMVL